MLSIGKRSNKKIVSIGNRGLDFQHMGKRIYAPTSPSPIHNSMNEEVGVNHSNQSSHQYLPTGLKFNKLQSYSPPSKLSSKAPTKAPKMVDQE